MEPPPVPAVRKRGRPLSQSTGNEAEDRARKMNRERKQRQYERAQQAKRRPTEIQLDQTHEVARERTLLDVEPTLVDLGLRIERLSLARDPRELELQQGLQLIEDTAVYTEHDSGVEEPWYIPWHRDPLSSGDDLPDLQTWWNELEAAAEDSDNDFEPLPENPDEDRPSIEEPVVDIDDITDVDTDTEQFFDSYSTPHSPEPLKASPRPLVNVSGRTPTPTTPLSLSIRRQYEASRSHTPASTSNTAPLPQSGQGQLTPDWSSTVPTEHGRDTTHQDDAESEDNEQQEISPVTIVADKLRELLQEDFHGCSDDSHSQALQEHYEKLDTEGRGARCNDLNQVFNQYTFPSVLGQSKKFLSKADCQDMEAPTAAQWHEMFSGVGSSTRPDHVCLHASSQHDLTADAVFDVDSYLGFASSLAFAKHGINYQPTPQMRQNIQTDIHIGMDVPRDDGHELPEDHIPSTVFTQLRRIPHFMMGTMVGCQSDHVGIYILFPEIGTRGNEFHSLSREHHTLWMDRIFLPSIASCFAPHVTQHLPGSFDHAYRNSYANQVEGRLSATQSYQSQQAIGYHIPAESLAEVWETVLNKIASVPGGRIFRNAQLFFSAKGVKLSHKGIGAHHGLTNTLERFMTHFERTFDTDFLYSDRVFIDIGKEICPSRTTDSRGRNHGFSPSTSQADPIQHHRDHQAAHVLLWKRCCLDSMMHKLWDGNPPSRQGTGRQFYSVSMLRDAANLTSLPRKSSQLRQGGLVYMQLYSSVKEVIDAAKQYPFQNDGLEELALDPQIRNAAQAVGRSAKREARVLESAYYASKGRLHDAIEASLDKSFGVRQEYRCTLKLVRRLIQVLRIQHPPTSRTTPTPPVPRGSGYDVRNPSYVWMLPTEQYLGFLRRNADKFTTGFEWVRAEAHSRSVGVSWESTKMMAMFLRCLRYCLGGYDFKRENALWIGVGQKNDPVTGNMVRRVGLGFSHTLEAYGYCWIQPRIDWNSFTFKSSITQDVMFGNSKLRDAYVRRGGQVQALLDTVQAVDLAVEFLLELHQDRVALRQLLQWMVHLVLRQFRVDVLTSIKADLRPEFLSGAAHRDLFKGTHPFSWDWIQDICRPGRPNIKRHQGTRVQKPAELIDWLFGQKKARRQNWKKVAFRVLYMRCCQNLGTEELDVQDQFKKLLQESLLRWHWVLPYPHPRGLTETNAGTRSWYSVAPGRNTATEDLEGLEIKDWIMLDKTARGGEPEPLPEYIDWDLTQWQTWKSQRLARRWA